MGNRGQPGDRRAFTLIELMIVVAIIALLIAVLLPSLARARQQAMQVACAANLNAIFKGMFYYSEDRLNGNGYLPQLMGHPSTVVEIGYWTGQICSYIKIKRSRLGSRSGLFSCPAHAKPPLRWICGPRAGLDATEADKLQSDTGQGIDTRRRMESIRRSGRVGELIEPVSYGGPCDSLEAGAAPSLGREALFPRKWTTIKRPHCFVLLTETNQTTARDGACFRFSYLIEEARTHPDYKRHYGGESARTNGSNFLYADGHGRWHSAAFASGPLICCVDFGIGEGNAGGAKGAQRKLCGSPVRRRDLSRRN